MHAVRSADLRVCLNSQRAPRAVSDATFEIGHDQGGRLTELQRLRRIDNVVRGEPVVQPARLRADELGDGRGESDHVVTDFGFDFVNAFQTEIGALADDAGGIFGDDAGLGKRVGGGKLDGQPLADILSNTPRHVSPSALSFGEYAAVGQLLLQTV